MDRADRWAHPIAVPASYRAMPRWWAEGDAWLAALPGLVVPVRRGDVPLALRVTPPHDGFALEVAALRFWDGRGVVQLIEADARQGAMLLERLAGDSTLACLPLETSMPIIGQMMRRLAVPAPAEVRSTTDLVRERLVSMPVEWEALGQPFDRGILDRALAAGRAVQETDSVLAVNGDVHCEQVLPGEREPWLVVDPVLLRGDVGYDMARVLWSRLDEMPDAAAIRHWAAVVAGAAGVPWARAEAWVAFRAVDYWLWGLGVGLTEDPVRCGRLVAAVRG